MQVTVKVDPLKQHMHAPRQFTIHVPDNATPDEIMARIRKELTERGLKGIYVVAYNESGRAIGAMGVVGL